ncbi:hypothetical protein ACWEQ0_06140 [Nocardia thailandica]
MVELEVTGDEVRIRVLGSHRIWALRSRLSVPRSAVVSAEIADSGLRPAWLRVGGTYWPGRIAAGTYRARGRKEFWDTTFGGRAVRLDLAGAAFTRVVVDVADPAATLRALGHRPLP